MHLHNQKCNIPRLFRFKPCQFLSKLNMYNDKSTKSTLTAIVRRQTLLVVKSVEDDWYYINCWGLEGWANITRKQAGKTLQELHEFRRYEDWKGHNHFLCNGHIMMGSDAVMFVLTNILLLVPSIGFFFWVVEKLHNFRIVSMVILCCFSPYLFDLIDLSSGFFRSAFTF